MIEETLGTLGNMGLHRDWKVSLGVRVPTGNSSIVRQSAPSGTYTHACIYFTFVFPCMHIYEHNFSSHRSMWNAKLFFTLTADPYRHTVVLGDRTIITPPGCAVCVRADNKWRWTGGSVVLSEEQLVL